jgi:glucokinase
MILAGDMGASKTRLALFDTENEKLEPELEQEYLSAQHDSLESIVAEYLQAHSVKPKAACFGFAGPVRNGQALATNLPWKVSVKDLSKSIGTERVQLLNDLEANAYGIACLDESEFCTISQATKAEPGNAGLISAGTGLGEAGMFWDGHDLRPFSSEGSHCDFAPQNEQQYKLLIYLQRRYGHVSWERVVSGMGLRDIYTFLLESGYGPDPDWLVEEVLTGQSGAVISRHALEHDSELCDATLDLFVSCYGAEAGNLALKYMAIGGIYLGGGIAPKILSRLQEPIFIESFTNKGRFAELLKQIPVKVILNEQTALLGAARYASNRLGLSKDSATCVTSK